MQISVLAVTGELAIDPKEGQQVFGAIKAALEAGESVEVRFHGVKTVISAFLNAAIGQLFGHFSPDVIRAKVDVTGLDARDMVLLKVVVDRAKQFYESEDVRRALASQEDDTDA